MFSIAALLTQWVPTIVHAISTGKATLDTLRTDFNMANPSLTPEERKAAWAAIITHDEVKAAIHHAAAGEDAFGNPLPPAVVQIGTQLREAAVTPPGPVSAFATLAQPPAQPPAGATSAAPGHDEEADAVTLPVEPAVTAGDVLDSPGGPPEPRPSRTAMRQGN